MYLGEAKWKGYFAQKYKNLTFGNVITNIILKS